MWRRVIDRATDGQPGQHHDGGCDELPIVWLGASKGGRRADH